jgi:hypothetical protein
VVGAHPPFLRTPIALGTFQAFRTPISWEKIEIKMRA